MLKRILILIIYANMLSASPVKIDLGNKDGLQQGAKLFINYCSGCHSLKYLSYSQLALDLNIVLPNGEIAEALLKDNLIFTKEDMDKPIGASIDKNDFKKWFAADLKDLSLIAKERGVEWLYEYLTGFYDDKDRPWGVNNRIFLNVAMPNVMSTIRKDTLSNSSLDREINSLINFLVYVSEPTLLSHYELGFKVILFLSFFLIILYFLKHSYWKTN